MIRPEDLLAFAIARDRASAKHHRHSTVAVVGSIPAIGAFHLPTGRIITATVTTRHYTARCRASGCTENHSSHTCRECGERDSAHRTADCPKKRAMCRVSACREVHAKHYCKNCGDSDASHFSGDCPSLSVPADLRARGIVAVTATTRPSSSAPRRCGAVGCRIDHTSHFCNVCNKWDVTHKEEDCFLFKRRDYTRF